MKTVSIVARFIVMIVLCASVASAAVTVTPASGGNPIAGTYAANGSTPAFRPLGNIVITESLPGDINQSQTNATLVLTAPINWRFQAGAGSVAFTPGRDITAASIAVTDTTITVTFSDSTGNNGNNAIDALTISGIFVQATDYHATTPVNILRVQKQAGTANITGIAYSDNVNFGTLSTDGVMPVELVSFTGTAKGQIVLLAWKTATELNNYGFEIERRADAAWTKVGFVAGAGTTNKPSEYAYADKVGGSGSFSYRLKQIDRDGAFTYTSIVEVTIGAAAAFRLDANYPNPFNPATTITFTVAQTAPTTLKVFNMLGQQVATLFEGTAQAGVVNSIRFDASSLPSGVYVSVLESGSMRSMLKMVLSK